MRIVGGRYGRRPLAAPKGRETRPTTDRVREAVFNLVLARIRLEGARVLDLFAGSGALGLEALSRGAAHATFVERHGPTLGVARANAASLGASASCRFVGADALGWLARPPADASFDLVLADPPYALPDLPALPALVRPLLAPEALFVLEHDARHTFDGAPSHVLSRAYGGTIVTLFGGTEGEG